MAAARIVLVVVSALLAGCGTSRPAGEGPAELITSQPALTTWLASQAYVIEQVGFTETRTQGVIGNEYRVSGAGSGVLRMWSFGDADEAARGLVQIRLDSGRGRTSQSTLYQSGPLVVIYRGSDPGLRSDLADVLGSPR